MLKSRMTTTVFDHSSINGRWQTSIFILGLLGPGMFINKNMNFSLMYIFSGKLYIVSITGWQEYGTKNDPNWLNLSVYNPTHMFCGSIEN
jgi:hypothetical protein